jgi:adenylate cyclase
VRNKLYISRKAKDSIIIICVGVSLGLLYPLLSREYNDIGALTNGAVIGFIGSAFIVYNEIFYNRVFVRQMKFRALVVYKSLLYSTFFILTIIIVVSITRAIKQDISLFNYLGSSSFYDFIFHEDFNLIILYALTITSIFIFLYQISKKMGNGVLWNFVSGNYHKPREEDRIFMFMDLTNSTSLAEDLGDIEYNKLLNDFFFDITDSIITNYGEIYRYVGDEVVVSWRPNKGLKNAHCIRTFFDAKKAIHLNREKYLESYGLVPTFTAGYHLGKIIVGEIGEIKSQISFIGNVIYETGEIEKSCRKYESNNLVSESLLNLIDLPLIYVSKNVGTLNTSLENSIQLFSIRER